MSEREGRLFSHSCVVCMGVHVGGGEAVNNQYNVVTAPPSDKFNKGLKASVLQHLQFPHSFRHIQNLVEKGINLLIVYDGTV